MKPPLSPCVKRCTIDDLTGLCAGCGRTLAEIAGWAGYTDAQRRTITALLPVRRAEAAMELTA
jgi:predicted Fe-S protein YdhL (DUF1289 family)